jgi:hypothetical protein
MRRMHRNILWLTLSCAVACGSSDDTSTDNSLDALRKSREASAPADEGDAEEESGDADGEEPGDEGGGSEEGGSEGGETEEDCAEEPECEITVDFDCDEIEVDTCKDLSNVVIEFADGSLQRFEGLSGHSNSFTGTGENAGKEIAGVWVKSGNNASGDGPGYGERFDAPAQECEPEEPECPEDDGEPGDGDGEPGDGDGDEPEEV